VGFFLEKPFNLGYTFFENITAKSTTKIIVFVTA